MASFLFEGALLAVQLFLLAGVIWFLWTQLSRIVSGVADVPFVPTPKAYAATIAEALAIAPGDIVLEIGSGDARILCALANVQPQAIFIGIERNPLLNLSAWVRKYLAGNHANTFIFSGDFFTTDLSHASKAYAYLLPSVMDRMLPKFEKEFRGMLASRAFRFSGKKESAVIELSKSPGLHGEHLLYIYDFMR